MEDVWKIINKKGTIDLATNLEPKQVCDGSRKDIKYYETGAEHGTITAIIDEYLFEITLWERISKQMATCEIEFSKNWKEDASESFTINSIYSDKDSIIWSIMEKKI